ncbi:MAG: hypothetical protein K6T78_13075 [Alicyclobacillus sp.]|nr:hypothetical protein [Alicyclobacillus sp.]
MNSTESVLNSRARGRAAGWLPAAAWPVHGPVMDGLYQQLVAGELPHALLFVGTAPVTRHFTEFFAKMLLCTGSTAPCGTCVSCRQMDNGNQPDFLRLAPAGKTGVRTAQIEELQARITRKAHGSRVVYVLEAVDQLNPAAANRLLKTLEEPQPQVMALLCAQSEGRVLPTIRSRCFLYRLGAGSAVWDDPLPLERPETNASDARQAAHDLSVEAVGAPDPAEANPLPAAESSSSNDSSGDPAVFAGVLEPVIQWTETLLARRRPPLELAADLLRISEGASVSVVLHVLSLWLRDVLHTQVGETEFVMFESEGARLAAHGRLARAEQLLAALGVVLDSKRRLTSNVGALLNLEQMCIRIQEVFQIV